MHRPYEEIIIRALLDPSFGARLLDDPRGAALEAQYPGPLAESLAGLRAPSLAVFAGLLHERVYGTAPLQRDDPARLATTSPAEELPAMGTGAV